MPRNLGPTDSSAESQVVIGFTEAELGLVLGCLFLVLWLLSISTTSQKPTPPGISRDSAAALLASLAENSRVLDSIRRTVDSTAKASNLTATCAWKRFAQGPIGDVRVVGASLFVFRGQTVTWNELQHVLASELAIARDKHCIQQLRVRVDPRLSSPDYQSALLRLRGVFYTVLEK
jgi:hypothetical protein